jgi:hypothetical protein
MGLRAFISHVVDAKQVTQVTPCLIVLFGSDEKSGFLILD